MRTWSIACGYRNTDNSSILTDGVRRTEVVVLAAVGGDRQLDGADGVHDRLDAHHLHHVAPVVSRDGGRLSETALDRLTRQEARTGNVDHVAAELRTVERPNDQRPRPVTFASCTARQRGAFTQTYKTAVLSRVSWIRGTPNRQRELRQELISPI